MRRNGYCWSIIRLAAVVLAAAAACVLAFGCTGGNEERQQYEKGVSYYNDGEYELAKECFLAADNYGNTKDFLDAIAQCEQRYEDARALMDEHRYDEAYAMFQSIPKYAQAAELMAHIDGLREKYEQGLELYDAGSYLDARVCFAEANGYSESDEYVANIDAMTELYNKAMGYMNEGNYEDAISVFRAINVDFEGSFELIRECASKLANNPIRLNSYIKNYNEEYPDGSVTIDAGNLSSQFVLSDSRGILITGVANDDQVITFISFWFSPELMEMLGDEGYQDAVAHCIRALNPYAAEHEQIVSSLDEYLNGSFNYGCMTLNTQIDKSGSTVIEAALTDH